MTALACCGECRITLTPTSAPTAAPTAAPTVAIATCFVDDDGSGGAVLRQTIGKTAATVAQPGTVPTQAAMDLCGWRFEGGRDLWEHRFCPGDPYLHGSTNLTALGLQPRGDYSAQCSVFSPPGTSPAEVHDTMVMAWPSVNRDDTIHELRYTLPSSGYCRFRIKIYDRPFIDDPNPATLELAGETVWTGNDLNATCAAVVSGAFGPGDVIVLTERWILALFWLELVPNGSLECDEIPAEARASECCGACPIPRSPTLAPVPERTPRLTVAPTSNPGPVSTSGTSSSSTDSSLWIGLTIAAVVLLLLSGIWWLHRRHKEHATKLFNVQSTNPGFQGKDVLPRPLNVVPSTRRGETGQTAVEAGDHVATRADGHPAVGKDQPQYQLFLDGAPQQQVQQPAYLVPTPITAQHLQGQHVEAEYAEIAAAHESVQTTGPAVYLLPTALSNTYAMPHDADNAYSEADTAAGVGGSAAAAVYSVPSAMSPENKPFAV